MKHWSEFIDKKTHETKRLAKISNALQYEVQEKTIQLETATNSHQETELKILKKLQKFYSTETELNKAVATAIAKANNWNSTPVTELQNPNKK